MKRRLIDPAKWAGLGLLAASLLPGWADVEPDRYNSIVEKNPFGLKPPPPPPDPAANVPPPPPVQLATVEVTGITTILSSKRALFEIIPGPGKPMIKPILSEGDKVETIEVVSIDVEKGEVMIKNGGYTTNMTIRVAKSTASPTPQGLPVPGKPVAVPPVVPGAGAAAAFNYSQPNSGRSGVIMTGGNPAFEPAATPQGGASAASQLQNNLSSGFRSIPPRSIRSGLPQPNAAPQQLSPEAQVIVIEDNRQRNPASFPPLPPTPLTPHLPPLPGQ